MKFAIGAVLILAATAAYADDKGKNSNVSREINNNTPVSQPPRDTGGRDINSFKGYQGTPHDYDRPYNVPSPGGRTGGAVQGGAAGGAAGGRN